MAPATNDGGTSTADSLLPLATLLHLLTIKLSSSNYLLWKNQLIPILESQKFLPYLVGTTPTPPLIDQQLRMLLNASLSEEAMAVVVGCNTAHAAWKALEETFSYSSESRETSLRSDLQTLTKGSNTVQEYAQRFKQLCDQISVRVSRLNLLTDDREVKCKCGALNNDGGERMVVCEICKAWHHTWCSGFDDSKPVPPLFMCHRCRDSIFGPQVTETEG